ncbi:MAG: disulfide bond formation protein DsbA [Proteobacteria bacterium]|nr:disulfide bond formation protein DsbA [Pseudomonadota bacterium]NOG61677.1 disulfide bond formation protein DsbA [Pseudomonadota bacterium]
MKKIQITHFSDVLCVWAYVSQIRINELIDNFGKDIEIEFLFFPVFGNSLPKIDKQWESKGGRKAYSEHVLGVVEQFGHLPVNSSIWLEEPPVSSIPSHLYLCAAQLAEKEGKIDKGVFTDLVWQVRHAFFAEARDISNITVLREIVEEKKVSVSELESYVENGKAYAALSEHIQRAVEGNVRASPTLTFNEDRQRLTGNVGYRIIEANVRELLERPEAQQTWC